MDVTNIIGGFFAGESQFVYSAKQKKEDNFAIIKMVADVVRGHSVDQDIVKKMIENMNVHMGRWNDSGSSTSSMKFDIEGKTITFGREKTRNYPYLDLISQSIATEFRARPITTTVRDVSKSGFIQRKEYMRSVAKQKIKEVFVDPAYKKATMEVDARMGNVLEMSEEQINERNNQIEEIAAASLPDEIKKALESKVFDSDKLFRTLFDVAYEQNDMKYKYEEAVDYMVSVGITAMRKEFGFNCVKMHNISPTDLTYKLSNNSIMIEDGSHANHRIYMSPIEIIQDAYHVFRGKDWKDIERLLTPIPFMEERPDGMYFHKTAGMADFQNGIGLHVIDGGIDIATEEFRPFMADGRNGVLWAQTMLKNLTDAFNNRQVGIKVDYSTWRWNVKGFMVDRVVGGRKISLPRGEFYKQNTLAGDVDVRPTVFPQTYQTVVYGDLIYTKMGPVEGQYENPFDISCPKLNIYGLEYNTMGNNVKNLALLDSPKIFQKRYNEIHESIGEAINFAIGDVLVVNRKSFEGAGGPESFLKMLYKLKLIVKDDDFFNKGGEGASKLNLSTGITIGDFINLAGYYEGLMVKTLRYNQSKLGTVENYQSKAGLNVNMDAPDKQLGRYYWLNLKFMNNVNRAMLTGALIAYKENKDLLENHMDEEMYYYYTENYDELLGTAREVVTNSGSEELQNLRDFKGLLLNYVASGGYIDDKVADIIESKTMTRAREVSRDMAADRDKRLQEERAHETEMLDKKIKEERLEKDKQRQTQIDTAMLYTAQQLNATDVDQDGVADHYAKEMKKLEFEREKFEKEMQLKSKEIELKYKAQENAKK